MSERITEIEYTEAKVYFPGVERRVIHEVHDRTEIPRSKGGKRFKDGFFYNGFSFSSSPCQFAFSYKDYLFCVDVALSMPQDFSNQMGVYIERKYLEPTKSRVITDFDTIQEEFEQIRKLEHQGRHQDRFIWSRNPFSIDKKKVGVYDCSAFPKNKYPRNFDLDGNIFDALKNAERFSGLPHWVLEEKVCNARKMAESIIDTRHGTQVLGENLKQATKDALKIYEQFTSESFFIRDLSRLS